MKKPYAVVLGLALLMGVATMVRADKKEIEWRTIVQALDEAPRQNKKIILDVYTDWCGWCKRMDRDTYSDASIASYMSEHFVASRMNPEKDGTVEFSGKKYSQREFSQALGVNGYPATAIFNEKGELLTMIPGYMQPKEFTKVLHYFGDDIYLTTKWEEYQQKN
jgi:thioredoxin-related protein